MTQPTKNTLETILVLEDDATILKTVSAVLERAGYRVLPASSSAQAIHAESIVQGTIHLLLSDVMMREMSGPDVAHLLKKHRPEMRVMLMSGFTDGEMLFLNYGWHFIEKPFVPVKLVERVNDILHTPERSQVEDHFDTRIQAERVRVRGFSAHA